MPEPTWRPAYNQERARAERAEAELAAARTEIEDLRLALIEARNPVTDDLLARLDNISRRTGIGKCIPDTCAAAAAALRTRVSYREES